MNIWNNLWKRLQILLLVLGWQFEVPRKLVIAPLRWFLPQQNFSKYCNQQTLTWTGNFYTHALDPFSGLVSFQVRNEIKYRKEKLGIEYYYS